MQTRQLNPVCVLVSRRLLHLPTAARSMPPTLVLDSYTSARPTYRPFTTASFCGRVGDLGFDSYHSPHIFYDGMSLSRTFKMPRSGTRRNSVFNACDILPPSGFGLQCQRGRCLHRPTAASAARQIADMQKRRFAGFTDGISRPAVWLFDYDLLTEEGLDAPNPAGTLAGSPVFMLLRSFAGVASRARMAEAPLFPMLF